MAKNNALDVLTRARNGIQAVFDDDHYKECLRVMGKFHNYSVRNIIQIMSVCPEATHVAGYQAWKKEFGRQVKPGEAGIPIIAWAPRNKYTEEQVMNENGEKETMLVKTVVPNFRVVYVFDISQTEGRPLPKLAELLKGNIDNYDLLFQSIKDVSEFPISIKEIPGEANGYCNIDKREIVIKEGLSQLQTIKTAFHEMAHADMHSDKKSKLDKRTIEVEAEATAFVVCEHFGMDTSTYSFPYIASWSSGKDLKELEDSLDRIQHGASAIISKVEARYLLIDPPAPQVNPTVKTKVADDVTPDHMLSAKQLRACVEYQLPVGYFVACDKETGEQFMDLKLLTELSQDDFDKKYENVYKDIKLTSQVKEGNGNDGFCYPESGCVTPIINPYVMTPMQAATTRFLLGEFMQSDEWKRIDDTLKYNAPVRYDDIVKVRDKYFDEQYFMDAAKNYPDRSPETIRNLAGYLTITEDSKEIVLPGHKGSWHITDFSKINGDEFFLMYNEDSSLKEVIVNRHGHIVMDKKCDFDDLKDRLDEEARSKEDHSKKDAAKKTKKKSKGKEER